MDMDLINSHFKHLISLMAMVLLARCSTSTFRLSDDTQVGLLENVSYKVVDNSGTLILPVSDIIIDPRFGGIDYILVAAPASGFVMDIRTAPYQSIQTIPIPGRFFDLEVDRSRFNLQVGGNELVNAPRFNPPIEAYPSNWRDVVDSYWEAISEGTE
jgi:sporulation protein YlmC with PRC-barrel domain